MSSIELFYLCLGLAVGVAIGTTSKLMKIIWKTIYPAYFPYTSGLLCPGCHQLDSNFRYLPCEHRK